MFQRAASSDPPKGGLPRGVGWGMSPIPQKACDMSILGFSIVGNSKMILIFILGYPHTPQGHPQGEGVGDLEGD